MIRFAANLTTMFTEWPFLDRFAAAAEAGFEAVEFLFPYDFPPARIEAALRESGLKLALFNLPPGDWSKGERGIAALPGRFDEFKAGVEQALAYAGATGARSVHMMAGLASRSRADAVERYRRCVEHAAEAFSTHGVSVLLEPINGRSMPGYFLDDFGWTERFIADLGRPNVRLQYDVFHRQIMHGDVTSSFRRLRPLIGHVQIASVPDRHEPDTGEVNYRHVFAELEAADYSGFVGCEYLPAGGTVEGLRWLHVMRGDGA